jgi:SHS2 domain-containing protein
MKSGYIFLPHTADIKFQAFGESLEKCFENAAHALTHIITVEKIEQKEKKTIKVKGRDVESLLYNFLEELLYLLDVGGFVIGKVEKLKITSSFVVRNKKKIYNSELTCVLFGDNISNYQAETDVKAVTYHEMFIKQEKIKGKNMFICQVIVDV